MHSKLRAFWFDRNAATAIEYGLIAGLIAVAIITSLYWVSFKLWITFWKVVFGLL